MLALPAPVLAQATVAVPNAGDISRQRVAPVPLRKPNFDLRIQTPERSAVPRSVDEIEFEVSAINVAGADYYPKAEVDAVFTPLTGRRIVLEDLRRAAQKLEDRYKADGFFLSRVFVPAQQVKDGVLQVQVVEGHISAVFVDAPDERTRRRLEATLKPLLSKKPVRLGDIESRLLTINDMPGITGTSLLRPGAELGQSELVLTSAGRPNEYRLTASNTSSSLLGPWSFGTGATLNRPLNRAGALDLNLAAGGGNKVNEIRSATLRYAEPIGHTGLVGSIGALFGDARPGGAVRPLAVRSKVKSFSLRMRYAVLRSRDSSVYFDGGLALNRTDTEALGSPIIADRSSVADISVNWQHSGWMNGSDDITVGLYQGLGVFGAIDSAATLPSVAGFEQKFTRLTFSARRTQALAARFSAMAVVQGQYSKDRMLSGELVAFGGSALGRGYDPSLIAGERGIGGLFELRYDPNLVVPKRFTGLQLYAFADAARTTTLATATVAQSTDRLSSLGVGARFNLFERASFDVQFADARHTIAGAGGRDPRLTITAGVAF